MYTLSEGQVLFDIGEIFEAVIKRPIPKYTMNSLGTSGAAAGDSNNKGEAVLVF